jgi:hypothetical protein
MQGVTLVKSNVYVIYSTPTSRTQKLKLMREGGYFIYSSTLPSCEGPVGCKRGIGVDCNLF